MHNNIIGMVFTDKTGQVVFVNKHFYQMMDYQPREDRLVGLPLGQVLRIPAEKARQLAEGPQTGTPIEMIVAPQGHTFELHLRSEAAFDDRRAFIGSNISVSYTDEAAAALQAEATAQNEAQHLEVYFLQVLEGLQVLLARMGGLNVRAVVDEIVLEHGTREDWAITINDGQFTLGGSPSTPQRATIYKAVLNDVLDYAFDIVGAFLVEGALTEAEHHLTPETLTTADTYSLRSLI